MGKLGAVLVLVVGLLAAVWMDRPKDYFDFPDPVPHENEREAFMVVESQARELPPTSAWAGIYSSGSGLSGTTLYLLPSGRYCVHEWADIGEGYNRCGRLVERKDRFASESKAPWESHEKDGPTYLKVRWGPRHYLIPVRRALEFVNAVNAGFEPRHEFGPGFGGYLPRDEGKLAATGAPELPEPHRSLLRPVPVTTRVTGVGLTKGALFRLVSEWVLSFETDCRVDFTLDAGTMAGVFVGMELYSLDPDGGPSAKVLSAGPDSAVAQARKFDCREQSPRDAEAYSSRPADRKESE